MDFKVSVVIPASGEGKRLGGDVPKQFLDLGGEPVLKRTLSVFDGLDFIREIAVAVPEGYSHKVEAYNIKKLRHIVSGKETRAASVYAALKKLDAATDIVLIHDGIRPFVTAEIIEAVAASAAKHGAAIACAPVTDTIKQANSAGQIKATLDRRCFWRAQTPQGFTYDLITRAYNQAEADGVLADATDDSALVERLNIPVYIVQGSDLNIKITTPADLLTAGAFIAEEVKRGFGDKASIGKKVTIYTDGACSGNPGPGGYGVVMLYGEHRRELSGGEAETTNNRMEMMGVIKGLESLKQPCEVDVYSDSRYVVDAIQKGWALRWRENNWKRNKKEAALNPDLWETLLSLLEKHSVTFHWVKGHAGNPENERCDELAREAIAS